MKATPPPASSAGHTRRRLGAEAEQRALLWLKARGFAVIERNYTGRRGEIDLIGRHQGCVVFLEVRYRSELAYVGAAESVDRAKRQAIIHTAQMWLAQHPQEARQPCRFDVLALGETEARTDWIQNAFDASAR